MIAADMYDCRFLDLFSGSGAMGIECLSRGGQNAVFVDNNKESIDVIKQNINGAMVSDRAEVMSCDVTSAISKLAQKGKTFDVIFMDPPYDKGLVELSLQAIVKNNILSKDGYIIAEQSTEEEIPEIAGLKVTRVKEYRITRMTFLTYGHLDIINRASRLCDKLIVGVLDNKSKVPLFTVEERVAQLKEITKDFANVEIKAFSGLLVDFARANNSNIVIRGLRGVTDFSYEFQMALTNRALDSDLETLFISADTQYLFFSSSQVKEIASFGGDIANMVPEIINEQLRKKLELKELN